MSHLKTLSLALALVFVAGCAQQATEARDTSAHTSHATPSPAATATATPAQGAALGTAVEAGHFKATLTSDPSAPRTGEATFAVQLDHHGEPATDAKVHVQLSMPGMNMGGPSVEMSHVGNGRYEGKTKLPMGGEYQADVHITGGGEPTQTPKFRFEAAEI